MASHYYPSVVAFLVGMEGDIEKPVEIARKFVLRKPYRTEMNEINLTIKNHFSHLPPIQSDYPLLEVNEKISSGNTFAEHRRSVKTDGENIILRAITFLRLFQFGHLGFFCYFVPLAKEEHCAYSFQYSHPHIVPKWDNYSVPYSLPRELSQMESFVGQFWNCNIEEINAVRLFNKSFIERDLEDKLNDLVFALEHLYLREEGERSYLSYKLAMRCAFMLSEDTASRKQIFKNVREGYKTRSKIIHSGKRLVDNEETMSLIIELEEYLRKSIRTYLEDAALFKSSKLDDQILSGYVNSALASK